MNISPFRRFSRLAFYLMLLILLDSSRVSAQNIPLCFQLYFPTVEAQPGDTVCIPLMARDFEEIISFQFNMYWNPDELEFIGYDTTNASIPWLMPNNFGPPHENYIGVGWSSASLDPLTIPDSIGLFNLCFRVKDGASGFLPITIGGNWQTIFEVVRWTADMTPIFLPNIQQIGGISTIGAASGNLSISSSCVVNAACYQGLGNASVEISGGQAPYNYAWTGPSGFSANTASISGLSGGLYQLTVTDQAGNMVTLSLEVKSGIFTTTIVPETSSVFCGQGTGCATIEVSGSHSPFTFEWSTGNSQTAENCDLPVGNHTVTVTDGTGCASVFSVQIESDSILVIPSSWIGIEDCNGTVSIDATPLNLDGSFNYSWSTGATTAALDGLLEGFYVVTVTAPSGGCAAIGEFLVYDASTQSWGLNLESTCDDPGNSALGNLVLEMDPASNMTFPVTVSWSDGTTHLLNQPLVLGVLDSLLTVPSGHYAVTVTDAAGCQSSREKTMNCSVPPPASDNYPWFYVKDDAAAPDSCAGIYAKNFEDVSVLNFSLAWPEYGSTLREIRNLQLPGLTLNDFDLFADKLSLQWQSPNPVTLPSETKLFEVCLTPKYDHPVESLWFSEEPALPVLVAQGVEVAFIGKQDYVLFDEYEQEPPVLSALEVLPADCSADGKSRILMNSCNSGINIEGGFSHKDMQGEWHSFDDLSGLLFADPGTYNIAAVQPGLSYDQFFAYIPSGMAASECVWPGDADNNNAVNHHDLLYLGLAFNAEGPSRSAASLEWIGQDAIDWSGATSLRHVNYKNIDANGDGIITAADTAAIVENWGRVINPATDNPFDAPLDSVGNNLFPNLTIDTDTLTPGEAVNFPLLLGSQQSQMDNIYGLAFSISYDANVIQDNIRFTPSSSWFGDESKFLWVQKNFPRQGRLDVAITRTDGLPVSGWGVIGNVFIIIEDNIFGQQDLQQDTFINSQLFFSEISSTSPGETPQLIAAPPVPLTVQKQAVATKEPLLAEQSILLSPNPASENLILQSHSSPIQRVEISSADGSVHTSAEFGNTAQQVQISLRGMPDGTYFARVFCRDGLVVKKFLVVR